ncbi:MAG TPA: hypothetical protein VM553_03740 [Dongiaceae bacterium]|nr:hypothetical protein [Dongiaceae bacterium]
MKSDLLFKYLLIAASGLLLSSCQENQPSPFQQKPIASLHAVMTGIIDPAVDPLWESVSVEVSAEGVVEHAPQTDEEWAEVRGHALRLVEATNLLLIKGRNIVNPGETVSDTDVEGVNNADEIARAINDQYDAYAAHVQALRSATERTLVAIDAKDHVALEKAGGEIEHACEGCHTAFWYPGTTHPAAPVAAK